MNCSVDFYAYTSIDRVHCQNSIHDNYKGLHSHESSSSLHQRYCDHRCNKSNDTVVSEYFIE